MSGEEMLEAVGGAVWVGLRWLLIFGLVGLGLQVLRVSGGGSRGDVSLRARLRRMVRAARAHPLVVVVALVAAGLLLSHPSRRVTLVIGAIAILMMVAAWGTLRDLTTGLFFRFGQRCAVGDEIEVAGVRGTVKALESRALILSIDDSREVVVPYSVAGSAVLFRQTRAQSGAACRFEVKGPDREMAEVRRKIRESLLMCHWANVARRPTIKSTAPGVFEVTAYAIDSEHRAELERAVRAALRDDSIEDAGPRQPKRSV